MVKISGRRKIFIMIGVFYVRSIFVVGIFAATINNRYWG